ncbi:MAG: DNA-3-methyladenine glycosylase [Phycisphaeraceae bacterium]
MPRPLPRTFYRRDVVDVARALLGQRLVRRLPDGTRLAGLIVETEAYCGIPDKAAHTANGRRTARNETMWGPPGHAYVYFTYGMHHCMNVVAGQRDEPVAALIRAIEPTVGLDAIWPARSSARRVTDLCSGPAKLCQALRIDRELNGADLVGGADLWIEPGPASARPRPAQIAVGPRIGIANAEEWTTRPLRFLIRGNAHVSPPRLT